MLIEAALFASKAKINISLKKIRMEERKKFQKTLIFSIFAVINYMQPQYLLHYFAIFSPLCRGIVNKPESFKPYCKYKQKSIVILGAAAC